MASSNGSPTAIAGPAIKRVTEVRSEVCTRSYSISDLSCTSVTSSVISPTCEEAFLVRELLGHKHRSNLQQRIVKLVQPKKLRPVLFPHRSNLSSHGRHRLDDPLVVKH